MARWLTEWVTAFADATPGAVRTATLFPEPDVAGYLGAAVDAGAWAAADDRLAGGAIGRAWRQGCLRDDPAGRRRYSGAAAARAVQGGERFRLRMSIEGKRAEEDDDDLVNHAS